jgi:hypothetical protein
VQRFQVGGDHCETSVAETVGRGRTSRPTSLPFYFRRERFNPAGKRGTLALVTRRPLQLLESRVSRLLLVILWVRGLGLSLADDGHDPGSFDCGPLHFRETLRALSPEPEPESREVKVVEVTCSLDAL